MTLKLTINNNKKIPMKRESERERKREREKEVGPNPGFCLLVPVFGPYLLLGLTHFTLVAVKF